MLRSLFSGVSGMRTHQLDMDVIADNIANVNTTGFKASRMTFKEVYTQVLRNARGPLGNMGGVNPLQVGLGVAVGSIDTLFTQGAPQSTGRDTDLSIDGNGFFILTPDDGRTLLYTRSGNFAVDSGGNLVYINGMKVMGWNADLKTGSIDTRQPARPLALPMTTTIPAQATGNVRVGGNLDGRYPAAGPVTMSLDVFDSLGEVHTLLLTFTQSAPLQWSVSLDYGGSSPLTLGNVQFNPDGSYASSTVTPVTLPPPPASGWPNGASAQAITFDFSAMTQYAQESEPTLISQDGYPPGALVRFAIDDAGVINGAFSNGLQRNLGQVALADFPNREGLVKQSDTLFSASPNTGEPVVGPPASGSRGKLASGFLEMSNVDLSQEFTNLILAQRGFQANSRVITTSDEMLQELMTLKR